MNTRPCTAALAALLIAMFPLHAFAQACRARSGERIAPVLELYTSEGCSSCPPADRWMAQAKADPTVVALAFHVDYWDSLGWADRFASPAYTQRQSQQHAVNGARFSYTPQVVIDGRDRPDWPGLGPRDWGGSRPIAQVQLTLVRHGEQFEASVRSARDTRLAAYWAVTEDGHSSVVKAGENSGATLRHEQVVREWLAVNAWVAASGDAVTLSFTPQTRGDPAHPREIKLVVVDTQTGRPVQAVKLGC